MNREVKFVDKPTKVNIRKFLRTYITDKKVYRSLRPLVVSDSRKKCDNYVAIHLPAFINIKVDHEFTIIDNDITFKISNSKVCVVVWREKVPAQIHVYE